MKTSERTTRERRKLKAKVIVRPAARIRVLREDKQFRQKESENDRIAHRAKRDAELKLTTDELMNIFKARVKHILTL